MMLYVKLIGHCWHRAGRINSQSTHPSVRPQWPEDTWSSAFRMWRDPQSRHFSPWPLPHSGPSYCLLPWATAAAPPEVNPCSHPCFLQFIRMILIKGKWIMILWKTPAMTLVLISMNVSPHGHLQGLPRPPPVALLAYLHPPGRLPVLLTQGLFLPRGHCTEEEYSSLHYCFFLFQVLNQMSLSQWSSDHSV